MFKEKRRVGGWIDFQYWRDDICLVYGQTYARVRTSEVRCSINRPLLKSHINALTRAHTHTHTHTQVTARTDRYILISTQAKANAKSSRGFLFHLKNRDDRTTRRDTSVIYLPLSLSLSLSVSSYRFQKYRFLSNVSSLFVFKSSLNIAV